MVNQLIERVFRNRDAAHLQHWQTDSYARHEALGAFYEAVIEKLDAFVETYQGTFGLVAGDEKDVSQKLSEEIVWLHENRSDICNGVPALENLIDEITALHMKTLYKLQNLK